MCHKKKGITSSKTFPIGELGGRKHTSAFHKMPRRIDTRRSKTLESIVVKEIGLELDAEKEGGPFGIGVTL